MQLAAWERNSRPAPPPRCSGCRRPEGGMIAWADGWYAVCHTPTGGSRYTVFTPKGKPVLDDARAAERLERADFRPIVVTLDAAGRCARCAYIERNAPVRTKP